MRIISDVDGVWLDFVDRFLDVARGKHGVKATEADVTQWDICKALHLDAEVERSIYDVMLSPGYARSIEPYPEARAILGRHMQRHEWYFATSPMRVFDGRSLTWTSDREWSLHHHFAIPAKRVIHASCKEVVRGDLLIEDSPDNVEKWVADSDEAGIAWAWLVDRPWNRSWVPPVNIARWIRRGSLQELDKYLATRN